MALEGRMWHPTEDSAKNTSVRRAPSPWSCRVPMRVAICSPALQRFGFSSSSSGQRVCWLRDEKPGDPRPATEPVLLQLTVCRLCDSPPISVSRGLPPGRQSAVNFANDLPDGGSASDVLLHVYNLSEKLEAFMWKKMGYKKGTNFFHSFCFFTGLWRNFLFSLLRDEIHGLRLERLSQHFPGFNIVRLWRLNPRLSPQANGPNEINWVLLCSFMEEHFRSFPDSTVMVFFFNHPFY